MHKVKFIHILCTDPRTQKIYHDYLVDENLFGNFDTIQYENPILDFLNSDKLNAMIERIKIYRELHGPDTIVIFDHFGCGAYAKNGYTFDNSDDEHKVHIDNNKKAVQIIKKYFPKMEVMVKYIAMDGNNNCSWWTT